MRLVRDTEASADVVSFLVAGTVFLAAVSAVILESGRAAIAPQERAIGEVESSMLGAILIESPGVGWPSGAEGVERLGLAASNGSGLEPTSILALKGALAAGSSNGKVDYAEARETLALSDGSQFHIRLYPVGMDSLYNASHSNLRVGYVGHWTSVPTVRLPSSTPTSQMATLADAHLNQTLGGPALWERQALRELGLQFTDRVHVTGASPAIFVGQGSSEGDTMLAALGVSTLAGDVYPDNAQFLTATLPGRLAEYDFLVIGSDVAHGSLTPNSVKDGIRDWVLAGGTLMVLGSASQSYQWLQPLFHVGVATVNGPPSAHDVSHPLLKEPHSLDWISYESHGRGWDINDKANGADSDDFSHVVVAEGNNVLAVSKDGSFGSGRILLTTYLPGEFAATLGLSEAEAFFENAILYADRTELYLDYGPAPPMLVEAAVDMRGSWLWDDRLGQVPVRIEVHTWTA